MRKINKNIFLKISVTKQKINLMNYFKQNDSIVIRYQGIWYNISVYAKRHPRAGNKIQQDKHPSDGQNPQHLK